MRRAGGRAGGWLGGKGPPRKPLHSPIKPSSLALLSSHLHPPTHTQPTPPPIPSHTTNRGHSFLKLNGALLDRYAACATAAEVIQVQNDHLHALRYEEGGDADAGSGSDGSDEGWESGEEEEGGGGEEDDGYVRRRDLPPSESEGEEEEEEGEAEEGGEAGAEQQQLAAGAGALGGPAAAAAAAAAASELEALRVSAS